MADLSYGTGSGDWREAIRRAQDQARATDELNQKEDQRRSVEERATQAEGQSARTRTGLAGATDELTTRLVTNVEAIRAETTALETNIAAMERSLALRRQIASTPLVGGGSARGGIAGSGIVGPAAEEDPQAGARLSRAQNALAQAELARANAQTQVRQTRGQAGTTAETLGPLVEQRELAGQQVTQARAELRAAQANVQAQEALAQQKAQQLQEQRQVNAALQAERLAAERNAAAAAAVAVENAAGGRTPLLLGPGRGIQAGPIGSTLRNDLPPGPSAPPRYLAPGDRRSPPTFGFTTGGPSESIALPEDAGAAERLAALRKEATSNASAIAAMGGEQAKANQAFQEASAIYADNSSQLSRHGALTTEFIQALARGQVTLGEFGAQMTATIGKFGGWVIAGAAIYGVYDAFKHLLSGATETQAAVQQLGRFIPGLGGPAGGGSTQIGAAESLVRNVSTQFNVPISEVTAAMGVTARVFHNLSDAGEAARAVLAASILDQVPQAQSTQYLVGISQALGLTSGTQVTGVVNSLNALQSQTGARVAQTLPGIARAAPAASAANVDLPTLEALVALGVRGGLPGNQVGTALLRSFSNFAFRPRSQALFSGYGIEAPLGDYGSLIKQVTGVIDARSREGRPLDGNQLRGLANALGGPSLGGRSILPILEAEQRQPGALARFTGIAEHPRPYQEDLGAVLGTVSERFKAIGITLQNFGSQLAESGVLTPITGLLDAFVTLTHVVEALTSPVARALSVFNELPGVVKDALGVFLAFRAGSALLGSRFGTGAQLFAGRLPGLSALRNAGEQRGALEGIRGNLQTYLLPQDERAAEDASLRLRRAQGRVAQVYNDLANFESQNRPPLNLPVDHPSVVQYNEGLTERRAALGAAQAAVPRAQQEADYALQQVARTQSQIALTKNDQYSLAERAKLLEQDGFVALSETVDLQKQLAAVYAERVAALRGGVGAVAPLAATGGGAALGGDAALIAGASVAAGAAASALGRNGAALSDLAAGVQATPRFWLPPGSTRVAPAAAPQVEAPPSTAARLAAEAGASPALGLGGYATLGATSVAALQNRAASALTSAAYALQPSALRASAASFLDSPALPFAGLIGTQLLGGAVGGGLGSYISNVGGQAATGAVLAQLLGRGGPAGLLFGAAAGGVAAQAGQGNGLLSLLGGLGGGGLGALGASALGGPLGLLAGAGALVGSQLVPLIFGGGGAKPSGAKAITSALTQPADFSNTFGDQLTQAISGSGTSASNAQNWLTKVMQSLTAQIALFGASSVQGQSAQAELGQVVNAAVGTFSTDPATAKQLLDGAQQAITQIVTRTSLVLKYADPRTRATALASAFSQLGAISAAPQQGLSDAEAAQRQAEAAIMQRQGGTTIGGQASQAVKDALAATTGQGLDLQPQVGKLQTLDAATAKQVREYKAVLDYWNRVVADFKDQLAQLDVQRSEADVTAGVQIAQAKTPDAQKQAAFAIGGDVTNITRVQSEKGLSSTSREQLLGPREKQLLADRQAYAQAQVDAYNATSQVAENAIPSVDPIARAEVALQGQQQVYKYMTQHTDLYGPTALATAYAAVESAQQALADATYQQESELVQAQGQLAQARAHGDAAGIAAANAATARSLLGIARSPAQRTAAQAQIIDAATQAQEATRQNADLQGQVAQAADYGNSVQQANDAIASAHRQLSLAQNTAERLQAQVLLLNGEHQLQQALADRYTALGALAASQTVDPVKQLHDQVNAAAKALSVTTGYDNRVKARTNLNQLTHQYEQGLIDQRSSVIDFQFQMLEITGGQAVKQLQDLTHLKGITLAQRQGLLEQIRRYQLGLETPLGATGFDLAPGNIKLPTYYDVAHGTGAARPNFAAMNHIVNASAATQINVYVQRSEDVPRVGDVIERATGARLRGKLRAAGVT